MQQSKDLYLLVDHAPQEKEEGAIGRTGTRLAHDTLAPLIRRRFTALICLASGRGASLKTVPAARGKDRNPLTRP